MVKKYRSRSLSLSDILWVYTNIAKCLFPLNYIPYLIINKLALVGDFYRGIGFIYKMPCVSVSYEAKPT